LIPYSTFEPGRSTDPGLPHPVRSVSRVSHPPDGFLPAWPAGCFSSRSTHGVVPFRAFSSDEAVAPLDARNLRGVGDPSSSDVRYGACCRPGPRPDSATVRHTIASGSVEHPPSRCGASPELVACTRVFAVQQARCSPGVHASPGYFAARTWGQCLPPSLLPWAWPVAAFPSAFVDGLAATAALRSLARSGGGRSALTGCVNPPEVRYLVFLLVSSGVACPGSLFHLEFRATSPRSADSIRTVRRSCRSPSSGKFRCRTRFRRDLPVA
jgi:hypothetical protein